MVAFLEEALALAFEVLLSHFRLLLLDALLSLEVLLGNIRVLFQSGLIVFLRALQLALHILLPTAAQPLQLTLDLLLFKLLAVAFDGQLFLKTATGLQLLGDGAHQ